MPDQVSRARAQLHHAREIRREQAADFWQRTWKAASHARPASR